MSAFHRQHVDQGLALGVPGPGLVFHAAPSDVVAQFFARHGTASGALDARAVLLARPPILVLMAPLPNHVDVDSDPVGEERH